MENKVLLLDDLGKKYGETHIYHNLKTPAEAIKLLCINNPEFAKDLATSHEQGIFYKVQQVDIDLELSDLFLPLGSHDLVVTPVISGSGDVGKIALGVGLVFATGGFGAGFGTKFLGTTFQEGAKALLFTKAAAQFGGFLILNGITGLITPQPTLSSIPDTEGAFTNFTSGPASLSKGADGTQTFAYTGATNSSGLGKTIPVAYGKVLAGSLVIGAQIEPDGEDDKSKKKFFREPGVDTFTINGDKTKKDFSDCGGLMAKHIHPPNRSKIKRGKKGSKKYSGNNTKTLNFTENLQHITTSALVKGDLASIRGDKFTSSKNGTKLFCIAFSIKGLIDRIADKNSTKIDGFLTFQVIVKEQSDNTLVGKHQMTIQGLMNPSNAHKRLFIVKLPYSHVPDKSRYKVFIKIIDKSIIENECTFKVEQLGYQLS